jgi:6-phosphogluconate dehydrogenase (decarboxylating)
LQVTTRPPHHVSIVRPQRINLTLRAIKVLSALRYQFGGHEEKAATKKGGT